MTTWDGSAPGYGRWWPTFERGLRPVFDALVDVAEVGPGARVLDIGTGVGEPAVTAARRAGPSGTVVAVDASAPMLAAARERAATLGVGNVDFVLGDAGRLPLSGRFDGVLAAYSLMFVSGLPEALRRWRDALRPGGVLAAAVQRSPEDSPAAFGLPVRVAAEALGSPPGGTGGLFDLADEEVAIDLLRRAGLADIRTEVVTSSYRWDGDDEYTAFLAETCQPLRALLDGRTPAEAESVWQAIRRAVRPYAGTDGRLTVPHQALVVSGRRGT